MTPKNRGISHDTNDTDCFYRILDINASLHLPRPASISNQPSGMAPVPNVDVVLARSNQV